MNDQLFASELAAVLLARAPLVALIPRITPAGVGDDTSRPVLSIEGAWTPYGTRRKGILTLTLRTRAAEDQTAESTATHAALLSAVHDAMLGAQGQMAAAKTALINALAARLKVAVDAYGYAPENTMNTEIDGADLRSDFRLVFAWRFL